MFIGGKTVAKVIIICDKTKKNRRKRWQMADGSLFGEGYQCIEEIFINIIILLYI